MRETVAHFLSQGYSFDFSWQQALRRHRPAVRDMWGVPPFHEPDLFTEPEPEEETVVEATRRFFEEAYSGQRPALRYFSVDMARFDGDETSSAAHNEDFRLAAA